ncbi:MULTISPECIES: hypothetical protein [Bacillus cereus group]|jgi:hypothetical protein|uniref:hypothetical protein n=1 Tax=Bacillus cereus group TaxID=86661 RepID=UPI000BEE700B|nr:MULTISPECIES: hypothetical protein [Bacillus cereus group]MBJ7933169.1 hypothetical protein [Bacillus cereus group sp. N31]PEG13621.1 hypothetical protein COO04_24665 [Bacillus toyonensis]PEK06559.1 hypothetical protein CN681_25850 [Bacillus toyonensis]PGA08370.1 hypothetical protein COL67_09475 [Bacillus toyonensis]PGA55517.1 hypothetical protein COL86_13405 [Bacillus toyonensis]
MLEVITAFFLLILHSIVYLFSSGETKQIAKKHIKKIVNSPDGVIILIVAAALLIGGIYLLSV